MSLLRDAAANVGHGLLAMWVALPPAVHGLLIGFVAGSVLGGGFAVWMML